jgi:protein-tyrosine phosphatase
MKNFVLFLISTLFLFQVNASDKRSEATSTSDHSKYWSYDLKNLYEKKVDNQGRGYEPLSELRNFRVVLYGTLYRSGANNVYNTKNKRDNENPISNQGLKDLCQQNFSTAFYLYKRNFDQAEKSVTCETKDQHTNHFQYQQLSALEPKNEKTFLQVIHKAIEEPGKPILVHCWNGWHASGLISTLALRQFCKFNSDEAVKYWTKNTDGNSEGYKKIIKRIKSFKPYEDLKISEETRNRICPEIGSAKN